MQARAEQSSALEKETNKGEQAAGGKRVPFPTRREKPLCAKGGKGRAAATGYTRGGLPDAGGAFLSGDAHARGIEESTRGGITAR